MTRTSRLWTAQHQGYCRHVMCSGKMTNSWSADPAIYMKVMRTPQMAEYEMA